MQVSVIIPSKNEPLLGELTERIHKALSNTKHEVVIIEKGDKLPIVKGAKIFKQLHDGLGKAVLEGVAKSTGNIIVTMDGDFSHDPDDIKNLLKYIKDYDIVIGSRFVEGGKSLDSKHRKIVSWVFRHFAMISLGLYVKDNMSGFAAIRRKVYDRIELNPIGYKINLEILYKAKRKGFTIKEAPIKFHSRKAGKSNVGYNIRGLKEALRIVSLVIRLRTR